MKTFRCGQCKALNLVEKKKQQDPKPEDKARAGKKQKTMDRPFNVMRALLREYFKVSFKRLTNAIDEQKTEKSIKKALPVGVIKDLIDRIFNINILQDEMKVVIAHSYRQGVADAARDMDKPVIGYNTQMSEYIKEKSFDLVKNLNDETKNRLKSMLDRETINDSPVTKIKEEVRAIANVAETRAERIARTETMAAYNRAQIDQAKAADSKELKLMKQYVATIDDRTTDLCKRLNGQIVPVDKKFKDTVSGGSWLAPPAHVNCRSTIIVKPEVAFS